MLYASLPPPDDTWIKLIFRRRPSYLLRESGVNAGVADGWAKWFSCGNCNQSPAVLKLRAGIKKWVVQPSSARRGHKSDHIYETFSFKFSWLNSAFIAGTASTHSHKIGTKCCAAFFFSCRLRTPLMSPHKKCCLPQFVSILHYLF